MHHPIKIHLTQAQLHKVKAGHSVQVKHEAIDHPHGLVFQHLHPSNVAKLRKRKHGSGVRIHLTHPEFEGTGVWSWLKGAAKDTVKFAKDNWSSIRPILTQGVDSLLPAAAQAAGPYAPGVILGRQGLKALTGVGIHQGPTHFPGGSDFVMHRKKPAKKKKSTKQAQGFGIIPAGYSY